MTERPFTILGQERCNVSQAESGSGSPLEDSRSAWKRWLFPSKERYFPGERYLRPTIRTAHILSMGILLGGHFFDVAPEHLRNPLVWTVATGVLFILLEAWGSLGWLFQVRGVVTVAKISLILLIPVYWEHRMWILAAVVILASISSHMPGRFRYYSFLTGRHGEQKKG